MCPSRVHLLALCIVVSSRGPPQDIDKGCEDEKWNDIIAAVARVVDNMHVHEDVVLIVDSFKYKRYEAPETEPTCSVGDALLDLATHAVLCWELADVPAKIPCGQDSKPTFLDGPFFSVFLEKDWETIAMSRWNLFFKLLMLVHDRWPNRSVPTDCNEAELDFHNGLQFNFEPINFVPFAASFVLRAAGPSAVKDGRVTTLIGSWGDGEGEFGQCTLHSLTTSFLIFGAVRITEETLQQQVMSPHAALYSAQHAMWIAHSTGKTKDGGYWPSDQPAKSLLSSLIPVFSLLAIVVRRLYERPLVGSVQASGVADIRHTRKQNSGENFPNSFLPQFAAIERERLLRAHKVASVLFAKLQIPYTLVAGPLLGAVRHHAPLPWENDGDICVPRTRLDELLVLALANQAQHVPDTCMQFARCRELVLAEKNQLKLRGARLFQRSNNKFILYLQEDSTTLLENNRGLHDPVIDIYFCEGWPGEDDDYRNKHGYYEHNNAKLQVLSLDHFFPLRRAFFAGISLWTYRQPREIASLLYGSDWGQTCRPPGRIVSNSKEQEYVLGHEIVPCSALDMYHSRVVPMQGDAFPHIHALGKILHAWLCAANVAMLSQRHHRWKMQRVSRRHIATSTQRALKHRMCMQVEQHPPEASVKHAEALLAPSHAAQASAHPVLHYLFNVALNYDANLMSRGLFARDESAPVQLDSSVFCEFDVRLLPITTTSPALNGVNFDNLWFSLPPLTHRVPVKSSGGEPPLEEAFLEVFSCSCWDLPLRPESEPIWDLRSIDQNVQGEVAELAAEAASRAARA